MDYNKINNRHEQDIQSDADPESKKLAYYKFINFDWFGKNNIEGFPLNFFINQRSAEKNGNDDRKNVDACQTKIFDNFYVFAEGNGAKKDSHT